MGMSKNYTKGVMIILLIVITIYFIFFSYSPSPVSQSPTGYGIKDDSLVTEEGLNNVVNGINQFGIELLRQMSEFTNIFISPFSLESALVIVAEGASGETYDAMISTLHLPKDRLVRGSAFAYLYNHLINRKNVTIELANAIWLKPGFQPRKEYLETVQKYYPVDIYETIDPAAINAWVVKRTHGRIQKIVYSLPPDTEMIVTNAIYFYGSWAKEFDPKKTKIRTFHTPNGDKEVPMMHDRRKVLYYEDNKTQAVLLPYKDINLVALIILPKGDINEYLNSFSATYLSMILKRADREDVIMYIPKFEIDTGPFSVKEYLIKMGMDIAFTFKLADFSGITRKPEILYINDVLHRVYIRVDEKGTEAAAATAVIVLTSIENVLPPKLFDVNRPFLFFIIDRESGVVLFAGKIGDPSK